MHHFGHPKKYLITGKVGSGKTTFAINLAKQVYYDDMDRIIVVCPTYETQSVFDPIREKIVKERDVFTDSSQNPFKKIKKELEMQVKICTRKGIPKLKTLIIIDDMGGDKMLHGGRHSDFASLSLQTRHLGTSIILISQQPKSVTPAFRDNVEGVVSFPSLRKLDVEWLVEEYNGCMMKKETFRKLVKQAWKGVGNSDYDEFGSHFLFILLNARSYPRYFCDLTHELHTRSSKKKLPVDS